MATKNIDERIDDLLKKQNELEAQRKALMKRKKEEERKVRTRRLIELGGTIQAVLGREITEDDKTKLMYFLQKQERNGLFFTKAMNESLGEKSNISDLQ